MMTPHTFAFAGVKQLQYDSLDGRHDNNAAVITPAHQTTLAGDINRCCDLQVTARQLILQQEGGGKVRGGGGDEGMKG